jgi:hypothetical protein
LIPFKKKKYGLNVSYAGQRQRRREEERSGRRRRKRERKRDLSPTHTGQGQRKREEERTGGNTWYSDRISLCIRLEREAERGFRLDLARNPDDLARSGRKPTHTGVGLTNPAFSPAVLSRSRRPCESKNPKRKDCFDPKQIKKSLNRKASGLSFGWLGYRGASVYICDVGFKGAVRFLCLVNMRCGVQLEGLGSHFALLLLNWCHFL